MNDKVLFCNSKEFKVIRLLGKGKGGYSYLVESQSNLFVLKQIHHEPCEYYSFGNKLESELNDYKTLSEIGIPMPVLLDVDVENERILKQYIHGDTIFDMVKNGEDVSVYINEMDRLCDILYAAGINIDYFPTNFVVENNEMYYIDYECNHYMDEWNFRNWGIKYWSATPEFLAYVKGE